MRYKSFSERRYERDHEAGEAVAKSVRDPLALEFWEERITSNYSWLGLQDPLKLYEIAKLFQPEHVSTPLTIARELVTPSSSLETILKRQRLNRILLESPDALSRLEKAIEPAKKVEQSNNYWDINDLEKIEIMKYIGISMKVLRDILDCLPNEDAYGIIRTEIQAMMEASGLRQLDDDWNFLTSAPESFRGTYASGEVIFIGTDGTKYNLEGPFNRNNPRETIEFFFIRRANEVLNITNDFIEALYGTLYYYSSLARFALNLRNEGLPFCFPVFGDECGVSDITNFYNPLLGLTKDKMPKDHFTHDYHSGPHSTNIVVGRNAGSKSTYITGRALIQLLAQIGSVIPATSCSIGLVKSIGAIYLGKVDIGSGQSTFSSSENSLGKILDFANQDTMVFLDDATEGTDPDNARDYMIFILDKLREKGVTSFISTQQRDLVNADYAAHARFLTTVPGTYSILPVSDDHHVEVCSWRETAIKTSLGRFL